MKFTEIRHLDNEIYHNSEKYKEFWSSSNIKNYSKTPKEAYYQKFIVENKQTEAMRIGTLIHDFLENKHVTGAKFPYNEFIPPINAKTGKAYGKTTKAYLQEFDQVKNPILKSELDMLNNIWDVLMNSDYREYIIDILTSGEAETSFFCETEIGLKYKYRPDVLTKKAIFDYKTINKKDFNIDSLHRKITSLGYDVSASFYQWLEFERTGVWKPFILVWLMKEPPFDVLITDISSYAYQSINNITIRNAGAVKMENLIKQHETCMSNDSFPGLANKFEKNKQGFRIPNLSPKGWHTGDYNEFYV